MTDDQLERVEVWDSHGNPYWNGVTRARWNAPGTGKLHRARIEGREVVDIDCGQRAEAWVPFDSDSAPQRERQTCSKCGDLTRVPGVEQDGWHRVQLTDEYAPNEWAPQTATDGGQRQFVLRPCRSRTCDGKITMHTRPEGEDLSGWRCRECLTRFEAVQETLRTDGGRPTTPRRHDGPDGTLSSIQFQNHRRVFAYETHAAAEGVEERTLSVLWSYDRVEHPWMHGRRPADLVERARGVLGR